MLLYCSDMQNIAIYKNNTACASIVYMPVPDIKQSPIRAVTVWVGAAKTIQLTNNKH
jgi:hypothetical protein